MLRAVVLGAIARSAVLEAIALLVWGGLGDSLFQCSTPVPSFQVRPIVYNLSKFLLHNL